VSSHNNLSSVSKTLANKIWNTLKDDKQLSAIIKSPEQISFLSPKNAAPEDKDPKSKDPKNKEDKDSKAKNNQAQVSVFLYNITELSSMRNQPQDSTKPPTLLNLKLQYLITPLTENAEEDQIILGKIMQTFAETPVLRGADLQGNLKESGEDLRITLDTLEVEDLNKLWTMLAAPYKLCVSYAVQPIRIQAATKPAQAPVIIKKDEMQPVKKITIKASLPR